MNSSRSWRKIIRLWLIFTLILSSGFMVACSGGGGPDKPQAEAGAPPTTDPENEKSWDKLVWGTGKWG